MSQSLAERDAVFALEEKLLKMPQVDMPVTHHFAPGLYGREIFIPKNVALTGAIHRYETMNILMSGQLAVTTDDGVKTLEAPCIFNTKPGTKKAGYAITDVRFINIMATELTDPDEIEEAFTVPDIETLEREQREALT